MTSKRVLRGVLHHVVMWSGGMGSRSAAKRVAARFGIAYLWCVITETFSERADTYRFSVEALFELYGLKAPAELLEQARAIPDFQPGTEEERAASVAARKAAIMALASAVMARLPRVVWVWDGRTPWEVAEDEKFIPSNRAAICSKILKAVVGDRVREEMFSPAETVLYFGLDWTEEHRVEKVRASLPAWNVQAPMQEPPYLEKEQMAELARADGITPSEAYEQGFPHDNCGGGCMKGGQGAWALLFRVKRPLFVFHAQEESAWQGRRGRTDVAILRDRRGGTTKALPLPVLASRIPSGDFDASEWGGCGCFVDHYGETSHAS